MQGNLLIYCILRKAELSWNFKPPRPRKTLHAMRLHFGTSQDTEWVIVLFLTFNYQVVKLLVSCETEPLSTI